MDNYVLKLSGKAEIEKPIAIGHNFNVATSGSIVSETISDNDDGTKTHYYTFKPVLVETISSTGERMRARDTRSRSKQLRGVLFKRWRETNEPVEFETWYDQEMLRIIGNEY